MLQDLRREANAKSEIFKRWFAEKDSDNVLKVVERLIDDSGVGNAQARMHDMVCRQTDWVNQCKPSRGAYMQRVSGHFHYCPA